MTCTTDGEIGIICLAADVVAVVVGGAHQMRSDQITP